MSEVTYETGGEELIERIADMWQRLNLYQAGVSPDFPDSFKGRTIDSRKRRWIASGANGLRVRVAVCEGRDVGYCLSFIYDNMDAVLESLFVDDSMRGKGVGLALAQDALDWFKEKGARTVNLEVTVGNPAQNFYEKLGFKPYKLSMRRV